MSEISHELPDTQPLANGESRNIPPITSKYGTYGFELQRNNRHSRITFVSQIPLEPLYQEITTTSPTRHENASEKIDEWTRLKASLSSVGKIYLQEEAEIENDQHHRMLVVANQTATEDFRKGIIEPMVSVGILPQIVLESFG